MGAPGGQEGWAIRSRGGGESDIDWTYQSTNQFKSQIFGTGITSVAVYGAIGSTEAFQIGEREQQRMGERTNSNERMGIYSKGI